MTVDVKIETVGGFVHADVTVYVDGEKVCSGHVGGEPEDNAMGRDYAWIPGALKALAEKLGAKVEMVSVEKEGDDDYWPPSGRPSPV